MSIHTPKIQPHQTTPQPVRTNTVQPTRLQQMEMINTLDKSAVHLRIWQENLNTSPDAQHYIPLHYTQMKCSHAITLVHTLTAGDSSPSHQRM